MRNLKELKDIVTKLEIIEEIKEPLKSILDDINTLLQQGHTWINSMGNKTYQEMKELLDSEMAKFLRQCFCIASNGHETFSETALTIEQLNEASNFVSVDVASIRRMDGKDNEHILGQIELINANIASHSEMLQIMQQKIKNQEQSLKSVCKLKQQTEEKFEDIMKELHEASSFMSNLSEELNETKEKEKIQYKKIQEISGNVESYLEQRDSIAKEEGKVMILKEEVKRLTDKLAQAIQSLETNEVEIVRLQEENVIANEAAKKKDKKIVRAIKVKDFQKCIEISIKEERELDDEGVHSFWSTEFTYCALQGRWLSRKEYILSRSDVCKSLTGAECETFWYEYKECLKS